MVANILLVDDEERVLEAYKLALRKEFRFDTVTGGQEALKRIDAGSSYQVIIVDMRMPVMNGVELLAKVKKRCPDTIRMMLTGNSDQRTAIDAINTGDIFRFLNKPCQPDVLARAIRDGLRQHQLITAERELLENTLRASIEILTELMALLSPKTLGFTMQVKLYAREVAEQLAVKNAWWVETLAMLSQIGCVTLPDSIQDKLAAGAPLLGDESRLFAGHPVIGANLIAKIPRLETMAEAIKHQADHYRKKAAEGEAAIGATILKCVVDFVRVKGAESDNSSALAILKRQHVQYDPKVLSALERIVDTKALVIGRVFRDLAPSTMVVHNHQGECHDLLCRPRRFTAKRQHLCYR